MNAAVPAQKNPAVIPAITLPDPCVQSTADVLAAAVRAGVTCWVDGGLLRVKGPNDAKALGEELVARKADVLTYLASWDQDAARSLADETDGAVERSGVSGLDAVISAAAGRCVEAHHARDMAGVIAACAAIRVRVAQLSNDTADRGAP